MPLLTDNPTRTHPAQSLQTRNDMYASRIADTALSKGYEAHWGKHEGGYNVQVMDISEADFETLCDEVFEAMKAESVAIIKGEDYV